MPVAAFLALISRYSLLRSPPDQKRSSKALAAPLARFNVLHFWKINVHEMSDASTNASITNWTSGLAPDIKCTMDRSADTVNLRQHAFGDRPRPELGCLETGNLNASAAQQFPLLRFLNNVLFKGETGASALGDS